MTDSTSLADSATATPEMGPLERSAYTLNALVLQLGLYAEMAAADQQGALTPEMADQFSTIFAATTEPAEA
jgi:hypothetical protein